MPNVTATTTNAGILTAGSATLGATTASSFVKTGGTSAQFLKADGSVDESTYLTSATLSSTLSDTFVPFKGATSNVDLNSKSISNINALSATTVNAGSFVKSGGTSSQYLRADGSVDATVVTTSNASSTLSNTFELSSNIESGTYNASISKGNNISNTSDLILSQATYTRIGSIVSVSVGLTLTPSSGGSVTKFTISLPVNAINNQDYIGSATIYDGSSSSTLGHVSITGTGSNTKLATVTFRAVNSNKTYGNITFSYTTQ